jgi:hypothetical protein
MRTESDILNSLNYQSSKMNNKERKEQTVLETSRKKDKILTANTS